MSNAIFFHKKRGGPALKLALSLRHVSAPLHRVPTPPSPPRNSARCTARIHPNETCPITLFAIKLGYKQIKYVGIDPHTTASFYGSYFGKGNHLTLRKYNNYSTYDLLNIIGNHTQFNDINFNVHKDSSLDFLSSDYISNTK